MGNKDKQNLITALEWHLEAGANETLDEIPVDQTQDVLEKPISTQAGTEENRRAGLQKNMAPADMVSSPPPLGTVEARAKAIELAKNAETLDELCESIAVFDGIAIKKSASHLVFADGNPDAQIMLIGEAPGADEDMQGIPFVGASGQLLDKILASIGLSRTAKEVANAVYITNVLNWRPPGNRTPNAGEIEVSLPFIEKHIALIKPSLLILCGSTTTKALLGDNRNISKIRGKWHTYTPRTNELSLPDAAIPTLAIYHPAYLLHNPLQKRAMWHDMLMLREELQKNGA